jgi:uncharacterized protein (DUF1919 family)
MNKPISYYFSLSRIKNYVDYKFKKPIGHKIRQSRIESYRKRNNNHTFSILCSNCIGGCISHDLGEQFRSPTVNMWLFPGDYLKFVSKLDYYLSLNIEEVNIKDLQLPEYIEIPDYPVGSLGDIKLFFTHYKTLDEAREKWNERVKRLNFNDLYLILVQKDGITYDMMKQFDALPFKNKVIFTNRSYPEFHSAVYIKGFEKEEGVGNIVGFESVFAGKCYYDDFDFVSWLNAESK